MKRKNFRLRVLCVASLLLIMVPSLVLAQSAGTGALTGTVTDSTGAVVPNVTVTATGDNGQVRTATTGGDGAYKISLLPPGDYRVKFDAAGFQSVEVPAVTITVTETGTLNRQLAVGAQTQQVTVEANVETIQTASSSLGTVIGSKAVVELPLSTRNYTNLIALSAGANAAVQNATAMGKGSQNISVNGASNNQNTFQMDGVSIANYGSQNQLVEQGTYGSVGIPSPDALQEFKIQTSTYDASYGRNPGANVNVVTKSGTNAYHGTAFEFFRNTVLNANDFFYKNSEYQQSLKAGALPFSQLNKEGVLNQNQYGGVFGGPVKKDKIFFFVSYQETQQKNGLSLFGLEPGSGSSINLPPLPSGNRGSCALSATSLATCGDAGASQAFAAALGNNICPQNNGNSQSIANSQAGASRANYTTPAAGTQVACTGSNIDLVALRILQLKLANGNYYIPSSGLAPSTSSTGGYLSTVYSSPALYHEHQANGNVDYVLNSKNTLSGRYYYSIDPTAAPFSGGLNLSPAWIPGTPINFFYGNQTAVLKLTSVLSNNLVNEARISYQRAISNQTADKVFTNAQLGITPLNPNYDYMSFIAIPGFMTIGINNSALEAYNINQEQYADQVSWTHGKHTIRAGFEGTHEFWQYKFPGLQTGMYSYNSFADLLIGLPGTGVGAAVNNGTQFSSVASIGTTAKTDPQGNHHAFISHSANSFFQDDIKLSPRLTVNLGMRWEYDGFVTDQYGDITDIWTSLINTQPNPGTGCVYNGHLYGAPGSTTSNPGTGCSFAGYVAPSNYLVSRRGALPPGVYQNNMKSVEQNSPPWDNFAPRVGFAWQPLSSNRFVVRGGAGYFYDRIDAGRTSSAYTQLPPYAIPLRQSGVANAAATNENPFPNIPQGWQPRWADPTTGTGSNLNPAPVTQNYVTPLVYQYNLNVQYEFLAGWVVEMGYVGSHGIHQSISEPLNGAPLIQPTTAQLTAGTLVNSASSTTAPQTGSIIRAPYLGFSNAFVESSTLGSFLYNSFQATVRKQLSHGLTLQGAYTYSEALAASYVGNPNYSFSNNVPVILEYGPNAQYRPHRFVINYSYNLPFGNPSGLRGKLVSGWNFSGVTTIQDGTPLTVTGNGGTVFGTPIGSNAQLSGTGASVVNAGSLYSRVASGLATPGTAGSGFFNNLTGTAAAFTTNLAAGTIPGCTAATCTGTLYGNSPLGIVLGPGQNNWDMSLSKTTRVGGLREDATLQFRAEFFNTFNHPQFGNPGVAFNSPSSFGVISGASTNPRLLQFALKYAF